MVVADIKNCCMDAPEIFAAATQNVVFVWSSVVFKNR